jgi:hypothetical protein
MFNVLSASDTNLASFLGFITAVTLVLLLINREVISLSGHPRLKTLSHALNFAIVPLVMIFALLVVMQFRGLVR